MTDHEDTRPFGDARDDERRADGDARDDERRADGDARDDGARARAARPGGRGGGLRARWQRASSGRRAGTAAAAGVVAVALVVSAGLAAQPEYPEGAPADGLVVDELRSSPVAEGWRIEPTDLGVTDVQPGCLDLRVLARAGDDVLVLTTTQLGTATTGCFDRAARGDRIARVDPRSGDVRWSTATSDVSDASAPGQLGAWVDADASTAVVGTTATELGSDSTTVALLDLATGLVLERRVSAEGPVTVLEADDDWVLVTTRAGGGGDRGTGFVDGPARTRVATLSRDEIGRSTWQADLGTVGRAGLVEGRVLVVTAGAASLVDPATGASRAWGEAWGRGTSSVVDDDLVFVDLQADGDDGFPVERIAYAAEGRELWRRGFAPDRPPAVVGGCVVFADEEAVTCVERDTGSERWSAPTGSADESAPVVLAAAPGQRDGDVLVRTAVSVGRPDESDGTGPRRELLVLDASTGALRSRLAAPLEAAPVAGSRTALYLTTPDRIGLVGESLGGAVVAFDLADGRALWQLTPGEGDAAGMRDLQFWGGTLVAVGDDGVVTQLVDDTRVVG
ncbi:PQQ-binding-like beta-propeller repeat protein [Frigoribacterium sp. PhB116]|uniref:PQQ-binding-like beta-propeller repeat protein n=1 Tax=Frigoribacterium sp. PhB116 TaxID=2485174 RepID=UPI00105E3E7B|nr:PQQ-binding-like beta-propeller repeat protein [Frigoribacterium sp. PhB116]TDT63858.1 putative pyrroloquinoline-quinone binding quinoprotein [Frigoribacterium sp. PhB116]